MSEQGGRERGEMPFLDHLEELRWRLIWSLAAVLIGCVIAFFLVDKLDVVGVLKRPVAPYLAVSGSRLVFTSPTDPILLTFKLALAGGLLLAFPFVGYQVWGFLSPALFPRERRAVFPALVAGLVLFICGVLLAYVWVLPLALKVLFGFQTEALAPLITANEYFGFATMVVLAFGAIFELPLVLLLLVYLRILSADTLSRHRRLAIVGNAVISAFLTPADVVSMLLMMLPVQLFYELSIVLARLLERRRRRDAARAEGAAAPVA